MTRSLPLTSLLGIAAEIVLTGGVSATDGSKTPPVRLRFPA